MWSDNHSFSIRKYAYAHTVPFVRHVGAIRELFVKIPICIADRII